MPLGSLLMHLREIVQASDVPVNADFGNGLPRLLLLQTTRCFDLGMLSRAMPELVVLLGICAVFGLLNRLILISSMPA